MKSQAFLGSNINQVKAHNVRMLLLNMLYDHNLSRVQLAERTGLSNTTITNLVAELLEQGLVTESDCLSGETLEIRSVGRPRTGICLVPNARYVLGIHIGVGVFRVALANLQNEILASQKATFNINDPAETVLDDMADALVSLISDNQIDLDKILGMGVGASGLVNFSTGVNVFAPNLNWRDMPIQAYFENALKTRVVVDNNVRAMALAEAYFGVGRNVESLLFVYGRIGVGAGFIYKGQVFRGSTMGAGEIGHITVLPEGGDLCRCGRSGCLETLVSEPAILIKAAQIAKLHPDGQFARLASEIDNNNLIEKVFMAARQGDQEIIDLLESRAYYLGCALTNVVNLLNPQLIILGGVYAQGQDLLLEPITKTVQQNAFAGLGSQVRIKATSFGWRAGLAGAAALALTNFFYLSD